MRKNFIEIKESVVASTEKLYPQFYLKSGLFLNTDETGLKELYFVNKPGGYALIILTNADSVLEELKLISTFDTDAGMKEVTDDNKVTEDFMLRTLAVVVNKEKYKDIK